MSSLPSFIALGYESADNLLGYVTEGDRKGYLGFYSDIIFNPRVKFAVENGPDGLVHIRCCYNNKYWTRASAMEDYITPSASEAIEDKNKWNCTLFKPVLIQDSTLSVEFIHNQTGRFIATTILKTDACVLHIGPSHLDNGHDHIRFQVFDYGSLVKLPQYVAFKGDNGKFLITDYLNRISYGHKFAGNCLSDKRTKHEIFSNIEGHILVKNVDADKFWRFRRLATKMIAPDGTSRRDKASKVEVIQLHEPNVVSLRIPSDKVFIGRGFDITNLRHALLPIGTTVTPETRLEVVEPILNRRVDHVKYRPEHSRIYEKTPETIHKAEIPNDTHLEHQHSIEISYTKSKTSSWNNGIILTSSVKTTFKTCTACLVDGQVEISTQISEELKWGECMQSSEQVKSTYIVPVPARHKTIVTTMVTKAKCDIPFSYVQTDTFYDGSKKTTQFDDGVYTSNETYDFQLMTKYEPL
ncbi:unnamed protein product [Amaranthus hypochondriacus]